MAADNTTLPESEPFHNPGYFMILGFTLEMENESIPLEMSTLHL